MNHDDEDYDDFQWVNELAAGFLLALLLCVVSLIAFFFIGYIGARLGIF